MADVNLPAATVSAASGGASGGLAGAALGAGINVGGQILTSLFGARMERERYQRALAQWERENAYNLPKNQVARLRAAGLNPALMNGAAPSLAGESPQPQQSPVAPFPTIDPLTASQVEVNMAQAKKLGKEARNQDLTNQLQQFEIDKVDQLIKKGFVEQWATNLVKSNEYQNINEARSALESAIFIASMTNNIYGSGTVPVVNGQFQVPKALVNQMSSEFSHSLHRSIKESELYDDYAEAMVKVYEQQGSQADMDKVVSDLFNSMSDKWYGKALLLLWTMMQQKMIPSFSSSSSTSKYGVSRSWSFGG